MRDSSIYSREERGLEPDWPDVFDLKNEPLLGIQPTIEPGARGSIRAVPWDQQGPNNMPTHVAGPESTDPDSWWWNGRNWQRCADAWPPPGSRKIPARQKQTARQAR